MSMLTEAAGRFRWPGWLGWRGEPAGPMAAAMTQTGMPGLSAALIAGGAVTETAAWGLACAGEPEPVTDQTLFQAASISKPVAAACALRLVAERRLDLDEPVTERLRSWQVPGNQGWQPRITLRQLLSHTAGLTVHGFPGYQPGAGVPSLRDVLDGRGNTPPVRVAFLPGAQFSYSGSGYCVLQQLLQDVTGEPFAELAAALVLGPAGMASSGFDQPPAPARRPLAAAGHRSGGVPVAGRWHVYPEQAAAGLWTTPADLCRFAIAIQQSLDGAAGALLPAGLAAAMSEPAAPNARFGLGLEADGSGDGLRFGHTGGNEGFQCQLTGYAAGGAGAAVMTNLDGGLAVAQGLLRALGECCGWPEDTVPGGARPPAGEYAAAGHNAAADIVLRVSPDGEVTLLAGRQPPVGLRPAGPGRWTADALNLEVTARPPVPAGPDGSPRAAVLTLHQDAEYTTDIELTPRD